MIMKNFTVQFNGPVGADQKEMLKEAGAGGHDYLPDFAFIVKMSAEVKKRFQ